MRRDLVSGLLGVLILAGAWAGSGLGAATLQRGPYLQSNDTQSVILVWEFADAASAQVDYGPTLAYGTSETRPVDTKHAVSLTGLAAGTRYYYRIVADGMEVVAGPDHWFETAPTQGDVSFLVFGDSGRGNTAQWRLAEFLVAEEVDLILHTGDVIYSRGQQYNYEPRFFQPYASILRHTPIFPTTGTHDNDTDAGQPYIDNFHLPAGHAGGERVYAYDWGDIHFVSVETETLTADVVNWVDGDLAASTKPWKIVYSHFTAYSCGGRPSFDFWTQLRPVLEARQVDVHFGAHDHNYQRTYPMLQDAPAQQADDPHYVDPEGVVYVVTGGGSDIDSVDDDCPSTAIGMARVHYTRADLVGNTLVVQAVDSSGTVFDTFSITKGGSPVDATDATSIVAPMVWPNPSSGVASLELGPRARAALATGVVVEVRIFTVDGRLVRRQHAATPRLQWDGRDDSGQLVPNGLYLVRPYRSETPLDAARKLIVQR